MPVLPEVGSRIVRPGASSPDSSAASIIFFAIRSFVEPVGLLPSSLAQRRTCGLGHMLVIPTSGVSPIASRMSVERIKRLSQRLTEDPPVAELLGRVTTRSLVQPPSRIVSRIGEEPHLRVTLGAREPY